MCGIIGYIGNNIVEKELINGLKMLEYRGYDSAGILTTNKNEFKITKSVGEVADLENKISHYENTKCGIAHTRWATHGKVNLENCHPHISNSNSWAIVHNGVIENYNEIKQNVLNEYSFYGETDTEVIANFLEHNEKCLKTTSPNLEELVDVFIKTFHNLKGSYAIVAVNKLFPNTLFLAKNKSPLFIATNSNEVYASSDVVCFKDKVDEFYELNNNEFCVATSSKLTFFNKQGSVINKKPKKLCLLSTNTAKEEVSQSYMLKEIYEIPKCLKNIVDNYTLKTFKNLSLNNIDSVILIGCGTAYNACQVGKLYFEDMLNINANCYIASEFNCEKINVNENTLAIFVTQSGETLDTLIAKNYCKKKKAKIIVITNVLHSSITKQTKHILPVLAGTEIAVASTKAYTSQIAILYLLCSYFKSEKQFYSSVNKLKSLVKNFNFIEKDILNRLKNLLIDKKEFFILGKKYDYITSMEASLKIKEITYKNANAYACGELKHGYIALFDNSTIAIVFATNKKLIKKTLIACNEIKARKAKVVLISTLNLTEEEQQSIDMFIKLPNCNEFLAPIFSIIPLQIISENISSLCGNNPDKPKNLAKSVTVE